MKYFHKYKKALEEHGYTVKDNGHVFDRRGNRSASEDRFGNVYCDDANVTNICRKAEEELSKPKPKKRTYKKKVDQSVTI
jgi:hypothetical protein